MPLNINLLAEEQLRAAARQAEPLKVVLRIALLVFIVIALAIGALFTMIQRDKRASARIRQEWNEVEQDAKRLWAEKKARDDQRAKVLAYYHYASRRLLWGNLLEMFQTIVPQEIYLTEITGSTDFTRATLPAQGGQPPVDGDVETRIINIRGRVRGGNMKEIIDSMENWLKTLRSHKEFSALFARPEVDITLQGEPTPIGEDAARGNVREVEFLIRCQLRPQPLY
jgi:Tfp pilus assembly protein PilN